MDVESALAHLLLAGILLYLYFRLHLYLTRSKIKRAHGCLPPVQYKQWENVIGIQYFLKRLQVAKTDRLLQDGLDRYKQYGNTYSVSMMGSTMFLTMEPENVKAILSTNFEDYVLGSRLKVFGPLLGSGIFTTDGSRWQHSRAMIRPTFKKAQLLDLSLIETHVQHLISHIPRKTPIDLQPLFFQLTIDSVTEFLLGESVNSLGKQDQPESNDFGAQFDLAQDGLSTRFRLGPLRGFYRKKQFSDACRFCHEYVDQYVQRALDRHRRGTLDVEKENNVSYVFLDELVKETNDPLVLRNELMNILLAGRDTTASLLSNLFVILSQRPDLWKRLQQEVQGLQGKQPTYETLRGLTFLRHLLNESLRLYPVVPTNGRDAAKDTILPVGGGPDGKSPIFVPRGARVAYTPYAMHRREDIFGADAEEFNPDRWYTIRPGWGYIPFNGGPRICAGQQYALTVAEYTVVRLVQTFTELEDCGGREWNGKIRLTMCSLHGTNVRLS
ncbi:cytochrome P450 alkane hydroxylase [Aspergillus bertholletiae]|uniref:Cytochrome P450 alkane hydroxylase n=1 Tax=Aspergillus bertholletiae TaxID=1226010 RepID=A0A5N7B8D5_9EURO|nr:cytochrome P450 alkane hydroxylase [Aspergillus bertholletiae]